ncbi:dihydrofolate reductase family protein [Luethyella okanaganae]|uniref:Dihydrofolate reductase family protein n=1 Tax=Luethyella okanaganae TaxID=69372 RepID=A0ABW1VI02_9MICO
MRRVALGMQTSLDGFVAEETEGLDWPRARFDTELLDGLDLLHDESGLDACVSGGARFARSPLHNGLLNKVRLILHPVVVGRGIPLFSDPVARAAPS